MEGAHFAHASIPTFPHPIGNPGSTPISPGGIIPNPGVIHPTPGIILPPFPAMTPGGIVIVPPPGGY